MSRETTNRIVFILSLLGFGVSVYLTLAHLGIATIPCGREAPCEKVARDSFARGLGIPGLEAIPTAAFGAGMYVAMAALSMLRAAGLDSMRERRAIGAEWALAAMGVAISGFLSYREAFIIHAWCWLCVTSAVIVTMLCILTSYELLNKRTVQFP